MGWRLETVDVERDGRRVLAGVDLALDPGEVVALVGPNGSGKSTLLEVMAGGLAPAAGRVALHGRSVARFSGLELARRRAVLPQDSRLAFAFPVREVVAMGRTPFNGGRETRADAAIVGQALEWMDLDGLARRPYTHLSGGERQRVQLARVLAQVLGPGMEGRWLLLDEPLAGLDIRHQLALLARLESLAGEGMGVILALHDLDLAARHARRLVMLDGGRPAAVGEPRAVLTRERVRAVFGVDLAAIEGPEGQPVFLCRQA